MATITIEITDIEGGQVQTKLIADTELFEGKGDPTPAQRMALMIREALIGDTSRIGLHMIGETRAPYEEEPHRD